MSNYATISDLKTQEALIHQNALKKDDLTNLKSDINNLDIGNLETNPADLSKLSNAVENDFAEKTVYGELIEKVNAIQAIDTSDLTRKS